MLLFKNKTLPSIRARYVNITLILGIFFTSFSAYKYSEIERNNQIISKELSRLSKQRSSVDEVLSNLTILYRSIDSFLLDPTNTSSLTVINSSLKDIQAKSVELRDNDHKNKKVTFLSSLNLFDNLKLLSSSIHQLINLRTDSTKQYPGLALSATSMAKVQNEIKVNLVNLILEAETGQTILNPQLYPKLLKTQHLVEKLISQLRIYITNRLASFSTDILSDQAASLATIHKELTKALSQMRELYKNEPHTLDGDVIIAGLLENTQQWYDLFLKAREMLESNEWRRDTYHKKTYLIPLFVDITDKLVHYKNHITEDENETTQLFKKNHHSLFITLTVIIAILILYILLLLFSIDRAIFRPINNVAKAMKKRAFGHDYPTFTHFSSLETQHLVDAFNEMDQQIHKRQSELEHQALHDSLTSLPNRVMLDDRLKHHITLSKRNKTHLTLLLLDLNHFKQVNDSLGHHIGDLLLIKASERLSECIRESDTLVRLGGDEFAILLPETRKADSEIFANKISDSISQTFIINDNSIHISTSIGIAGYPDDANDNSTLMQLVDIAMYHSKQNKTPFTLYSSEINYHITNRISILNDLHEAITDDKLEIYFQPQINLFNGEISGCEALLRWQHDSHGMIPAEEIILLAEQFGMMNKLSYWILNTAIMECKKWHTFGYDLGVAVNLSTHNLNDHKLCNTIDAILKTHNLEASYLTLEITENSMMANPGRSIETLNQLSKIGVNLSIDDFGTGFSSLSYLKDLPVNEVKIDKSFVLDMENNKNEQTIVQSTIDLGHNLGLVVVAEGIESISTSTQLKKMGCDFGQGHWILKAVNSQDILKWISEYTDKTSPHSNEKSANTSLNKIFFPLQWDN